jgi:hypothetical protein
MNFGPLIPQEIEGIVKFLEENKIPFEIIFNEEGARKELEPSPGNNILYSDLRTKSYLAQHFYVEVSDEFLVNNPKVENQILKYITNHDFENDVQDTEENIIHLSEDYKLKERSTRAKNIKKIFSIIYLAMTLYALYQILTKAN